MENSYYNHANRAYFLCKSYLFVKFFVIFLFIANVTLANGNGTSELYDIKKGTLLEYFKDIEKETGYVFIYSKDIRPSLNQVVSVDLSRKKTITEKLSALFEKTNLVYEINGKQIVVKRKTAVKKNLSMVDNYEKQSENNRYYYRYKRRTDYRCQYQGSRYI